MKGSSGTGLSMEKGNSVSLMGVTIWGIFRKVEILGIL